LGDFDFFLLGEVRLDFSGDFAFRLGGDFDLSFALVSLLAAGSLVLTVLTTFDEFLLPAAAGFSLAAAGILLLPSSRHSSTSIRLSK